MKHVLFVCGRNRFRSPTAEQIFADFPDVETASAGLNPDADNPLTEDLLEWADIIFVMESAHRRKLASRFRRSLKDIRVICLDIPDKFRAMDADLVRLLKSKVTPHLG
jgi:predicted protein tyrosine phosphatase